MNGVVSIPTAIEWAGGTPKIVDMLLACDNIDLNNQDRHGDTLICSAAQVDRTEIGRPLVKRSDVDVNRPNHAMFTPLIWAASRGHLVIVDLLLTRDDIMIDAQENGSLTAIAWAAYEGNADAIRLLVDQGADFNLADNQGRTSLDHAAIRKHGQAMKLLTEASIKANLARLTPELRVLYLQKIPSAPTNMVGFKALKAFST